VNNWKKLTNSRNRVRKKSFGGTFCFSNCHIIGLDKGGLVSGVRHHVGTLAQLSFLPRYFCNSQLSCDMLIIMISSSGGRIYARSEELCDLPFGEEGTADAKCLQCKTEHEVSAINILHVAKNISMRK
jgi:hypothetical protein